MEFDRIDLESKLFVQRRMREADGWRLELAARTGKHGRSGSSADGLPARARLAVARAKQVLRSGHVRPEPQCC
jgi:hypothetical protein